MNMNPQMMEQAMKMMSNMTPEQMQQMMGQVGQMDPGMLRQAQQQMQGLSPTDMERMQAQMASMDPATLAQQAKQATDMMSAQQKYVVSGSNMLKTEGNKLHSAGEYAKAAEKYARARDNLAGMAQAEAVALRKACLLNLGSCYLNLQRHEQCVEACQEVLAVEPNNLKALYRRGQAHAALQQHQQAASDLEAAAALSQSDPQQLQLIKDKLAAVREQLATQPPAEQQQQQQPQPSSKAAAASDDQDGLIEDEPADAVAPAAPAAPTASAPALAAAAAGTSNAGSTDFQAQMQQMQEMMRSNPDLVKQATSMMASMSPEQLAQMTQHGAMPPGMPALSPEQMQLLARMDGMQAPQALMSDPAARAQAAEIMRDPGMVKAAAQLMKSMPKEQMAAAMAQAGGAGMPPGMSPEMLSSMADMMAAMPEEQLAAMASMAAAGGAAPAAAPAAAAAAGRGGGGGGSSAARTTTTTTTTRSSAVAAAPAAAAAAAGPGAMGDMAGMAAMMQDPAMMKLAMSMMQHMKPEDMAKMQQAAMGGGAGGDPMAAGLDASALTGNPALLQSMVSSFHAMDEETIKQFLVSGGMAKDEAHAASLARQFKAIPPSAVQFIASAGVTIQQGVVKARQAREWLARNPLMAMAMVLLLLAILLRVLGVM